MHLGILAYQMVNTIRHQLKNHNINSSWMGIVRMGNSQEKITTSGNNTFGKTKITRKCSEPNEKLKITYDALESKSRSFTKRKSVVNKPEPKKLNSLCVNNIYIIYTLNFQFYYMILRSLLN